MKIISRVPKDKVMVIMSENELANVLGHYNRYSDSFIKSIEAAIAGETEFDITKPYKKHYLIKSIQERAIYDTARTKLEDMLEALTPIEDLLMKIPIE